MANAKSFAESMKAADVQSYSVKNKQPHEIDAGAKYDSRNRRLRSEFGTLVPGEEPPQYEDVGLDFDV